MEKTLKNGRILIITEWGHKRLRAHSVVVLSFFALLSSTATFAVTLTPGQQLFVTDEFTIEMRSGNSRDHRIIKFIGSGTQLRLKQLSDDEQWAEISTETGLTGWMETQYLSSSPAFKAQFDHLKTQYDTLSQSQSNQSKALATANSTLESKQSLIKQLKTNLTELQRQHDELEEISQQTVEIDKRNQRLNTDLELLKAKNEELAIENTQLEHDRYHDGIIHGTLALLVGCLLTLLIPRFAPKKTASSWN